MPVTVFRFFLSLVIVAVLAGRGIASVPVVYLEQSHAGSFAFFTEETDCFQKYRMLLIDAHSDSNAVPDSDSIRHGVLNVSDIRERSKRLDQWREEGRIQCFNWLEPLMPQTVESVYWMPSRELLKKKSPSVLTDEAVAYLDGRLEIDSRECGSLADQWKTVGGWHEVPTDTRLPWLVSIDLDAFANDSDPEASLEQCWERIIQLHDLKAVSIAVSRPWQKDDDAAFRLWEKALRLALNTHPARVVFNGCSLPGRDDSYLANSRKSRGESVPELELKRAPSSMWALISAHEDRLFVSRWRDEWTSLFQPRRKSVPKVEVSDAYQSLDGIWRVGVSHRRHLQIDGVPKGKCRFFWYRLLPSASSINLKQSVSMGASFTEDAGGCILWKEQLIAETDDPFLDHDTWRHGISLGRSWWKVVIHSEGEVWESVPATISVTEGEGFHSALSEQFGTPYMFGAGSVPYGHGLIAETGMGNDCANMIVYAWRRMGHKIPWCSPKELTRFTRKIGSFQKGFDRISFTQEEKINGIVLDALFHAAALWEDKPPLGSLGSEDILIHHLSGFPELLTLKEFRSRYKRYPISAWILKSTGDLVDIAMLGDVIPVGHDIHWETFCQSLKPFDLVIANAEGCVSDGSGEKKRGRKFIFQVDSGSFSPLLREAGVQIVSLSNNHIEDGGCSGVQQTIRELNSSGIQTVGAGRTVEESLKPAVVQIKGKTIAVWGIAHEEALHPPEHTDIHLARLPGDYSKLLDSLNKWRNQVDIRIIMIHWGDENTDQLTDNQREWSRKLASSGVDVICGSHSHILQKPDILGTTLIFPSLGNARMPMLGSLPDSNSRGWGYITTGSNVFRKFGVKDGKQDK